MSTLRGDSGLRWLYHKDKDMIAVLPYKEKESEETKFERMGHKLGDKFVVIREQSTFKVGDVVTSTGQTGLADCAIFRGDKGDEFAMYFTGPNIEVIPLKVLAPNTNTLNVGEVGSPRYEVIRKVLAVLDGDEVRYREDDVYGCSTSIHKAAKRIDWAIEEQTRVPHCYQLKSEQGAEEVSEKDLKIKEMEENIEALKKNLEDLKKG